MAEEVRTYWLSFVDPDRPAGQRFLGVAIVEVTATEAAAARPRLPPQAKPGMEWHGAALRKAWQTGCNPGGEVEHYELDPAHLASAPSALPRHRLMQKPELQALGLIGDLPP